MATSVYFGVWCRECESHVPLVEVISGPRIYQWVLPCVPPFEVRCCTCNQRFRYTDADIMVFEEQTLANFAEHPVFRNV